MATAKVQPSGMWKVRAYSHIGPDGKQHYRSFTAPTKAEAEAKAAAFSAKADRATQVNLTVAEAIDGYISAKEAVLSPSTIRTYRDMERLHFDQIGRKRIHKLTSADVQNWISDLTNKLAPKSVKNVYGLLTSTFDLYAPEIVFRVDLPVIPKKRTHAPTSDQVMQLFDAASPMLKKCIALAAFTSMRRGEICALKYSDIHGNRIHVHADIVRTKDRKWVYKPYPKTEDSDRFVPVPPEVIQLLGDGDPEAFIIDRIPDTVSKRFEELCKRLGIDEIRFHDLRKYWASIAAVLIPNYYAESFGGWRHGSKVLTGTYQQTIVPIEEQYADQMREHFSKMIKGDRS